MAMHVPNAHRVRTGRMASDNAHGNNGAFFVPNKVGPIGIRHIPLRVIASDGSGADEADPVRYWEHVSVSLPHRCPTWEEMAYIKGIFWDAEDAVMQLHPPASTYVNNHPYCLHLWRPTSVAIPLPPAIAVGIVGIDENQAQALTDICR